MKINKLNYETYAIDYLEGQLSAEDRSAFERFVERHPEVKAEMDEFLQAPLLTEDNSIVYEPKSAAKKRGAGLYVLLSGLLLLVVGTGLWMYFGASVANPPEANTSQTVPQEVESYVPLAQSPTHVNERQQEQPAETTDSKTLQKETVVQPTRVIDEATHQLAAVTSQITMPAHSLNNSAQAKALEINSTTTAGQSRQPLLASQPTIGDRATLSIKSAQEASGQSVEYKSTETVVASAEPTPLASRLVLPSVSVISEVSSEASLNEPRIIELVATTKEKAPTNKKQKLGWRKIFTPQSYEDIDLKKALVSQNLKSAVEESENTFVPEIFITK